MSFAIIKLELDKLSTKIISTHIKYEEALNKIFDILKCENSKNIKTVINKGRIEVYKIDKGYIWSEKRLDRIYKIHKVPLVSKSAITLQISPEELNNSLDITSADINIPDKIVEEVINEPSSQDIDQIAF